MTTDNAIIDELVQDVRDLIGVKSYGLYELIWTLNTDHPELTQHEKLEASMTAVKILVSEDNLRIVKLNWPSEDVLDEMPLSHVTATDFDDPTKLTPYAALMER